MYERERERIARLREFAAQLERVAPGRARDELLREVRRRAVLLDTGPAPGSVWDLTSAEPRVHGDPVQTALG